MAGHRSGALSPSRGAVATRSLAPTKPSTNASTDTPRRCRRGTAGSGRVGFVSPVSRGRKAKSKNKRNSTRRPAAPALFAVPDECGCPMCTGADLDLDQLLDALTATASELGEADDPLDAEIVGAMVLSSGPSAVEDVAPALVEGLIPALETLGDVGAAALLLSIAAVAPGTGGPAAAAAADRLAASGRALPSWAAELGEPVTVSGCCRLHDTEGSASILACSFHRAGRSHAILVSVDDFDCGAASDIVLLDADQLPEALDSVLAGARSTGFEIVTELLEPADFRWHVQNALDARAVHDRSDLDDLGLDLDADDPPYDDDGGPDDEDGVPSYPTLATLLRSRMAALPAPTRAPASHPTHEPGAPDPVLQLLARLAEQAPFGAPSRPGRAAMRSPLPAQRKKDDRPAPGYQLKVSLRGTRPPIWRRVEVPADISLARLHDVIRLAFGWYGGHLHVFSTPHGEFGDTDAEFDLGHRPEAPVTLEQVAPAARSKITYTYDFGDDWTHDVVVEKVLDRDEPTRPRCTGGRRAAPPEDSGGIWGYAELIEALHDPGHPEHVERLEWLGLDDPADFDPERFEPAAVSKALARMR